MIKVCVKIFVICVMLFSMAAGAATLAGDFGMPPSMGSEGQGPGQDFDIGEEQPPANTADSDKGGPCGEDEIELNTNIPFIGRCISKNIDGGDTTIANAFPKLLGGLMRILMTAVVVVGFLGILVGGFMIASGGIKSDRLSSGKSLILKVIIGLILLGASGIILNLINPNFFGSSSQPGIIAPFITLYR